MLTEPTTEKLQAMRLDTMASTWRDQTGKPEIHKLAFDEGFGILVDAEWLHRENKRLATALRDAKLRMPDACIEDVDYPPKRELDKAQIRQLATCRWVVEQRPPNPVIAPWYCRTPWPRRRRRNARSSRR